MEFPYWVWPVGLAVVVAAIFLAIHLSNKHEDNRDRNGP